MSWRKLAYLDEVATLSDASPQDVKVQTASAGVGTAAARDDHKHNVVIKLNECSVPDATVDLNKQSIKNVVIDPLATAPSSPVNGQIYFNTVDKHYYGYAA